MQFPLEYTPRSDNAGAGRSQREMQPITMKTTIVEAESRALRASLKPMSDHPHYFARPVEEVQQSKSDSQAIMHEPITKIHKQLRRKSLCEQISKLFLGVNISAPRLLAPVPEGSAGEPPYVWQTCESEGCAQRAMHA